MRTTLLALALSLAACGGGAIDGTYKSGTEVCDGSDVTSVSPTFTLTIADKAGTFALAFGPACSATLQETYDYPKDGQIKITANSVACTGTGCNAVFGAACMPLPPVTTFDYALSGTTLTFSEIAAGPPADACVAGKTLVYTMSKQ